MRVLIQRVLTATVSIEGGRSSHIGKGMLLFAGVSKSDNTGIMRSAAQKIIRLRIFDDESDKMNLDLLASGGKILSVPQFTLCASTEKGNRPSFDNACSPYEAKGLWTEFCDLLRDLGAEVEEGFFGKHMKVESINDGPVSFVLDF